MDRSTSHSARQGFVASSSHSSASTLPRSQTNRWSGPERHDFSQSHFDNSSSPERIWRVWDRCWWWPWDCPHDTAPAASSHQRKPRPCFCCPETPRSSILPPPARLLACKVFVRWEKEVFWPEKKASSTWMRGSVDIWGWPWPQGRLGGSCSPPRPPHMLCSLSAWTRSVRRPVARVLMRKAIGRAISLPGLRWSACRPGRGRCWRGRGTVLCR